MKTTKVLVFPCGSEIGLEIHEALKDIRYIELHGASSVRDHGAFVYERYHEGLPFLSERSFKDELIQLLEENEIDVVFPAMDSAVLKLAEIADVLPCKVVSSSYETAKICRNKGLTYRFFADCWFNPQVFSSAADVESFPVIIKPSVGQGSQGFRIIEAKETLEFELAERVEEQVVCEYLPGEEYTIDCFTDREGRLRYASQRVRRRTKSGISVNSCLTQPDQVVKDIAETINGRLEMRGVWFFQLKKNADGEYRLLEIAPRVAGTMCLERAVGVNLPLLSVFDVLGYDVDIIPQFDECEVDRALYNIFNVPCCYDHVYLDFDDTLVCDGVVNLRIMAFLYQCVNRKVPVSLLTRHAKDIHESLREAKISELLFDQIIVLGKDEPKSSYVKKGKSSVFIDDSFAERKEVFLNAGAVTLGLESVEVLLDRKS